MLQDWTIYSWYCPNCKTEVCGLKDKKDQIKAKSWYCPNCKTEVCGLKNKKDQIKAKCEMCGVQMVRKSIGRRHLQIDIYAPDYNESKII